LERVDAAVVAPVVAAAQTVPAVVAAAAAAAVVAAVAAAAVAQSEHAAAAAAAAVVAAVAVVQVEADSVATLKKVISLEQNLNECWVLITGERERVNLCPAGRMFARSANARKI